VKDPRRRDIAPTGELAGLPARDAPKSSEVWPRSLSERGLQKSSQIVNTAPRSYERRLSFLRH
jgi:hypothetical protein